jgi:Zn-finger nucleic acid-binding protein
MKCCCVANDIDLLMTERCGIEIDDYTESRGNMLDRGEPDKMIGWSALDITIKAARNHSARNVVTERRER